MREFRSYGSVGEAPGNRCFYPEREHQPKFQKIEITYIGDIDNFCSVTGRRILPVPLECDKYIIKNTVEKWPGMLLMAYIIE